MSGPTVFISYSHRDERLLKALLVHLKPFERTGSVSAWSDKQIRSGSKWRAEIDAALAKASVGLLLVSPHFLASDFIHDHELGPLLRAMDERGVELLWVQLRASAHGETALKELQAVVSPPAKPLAEMSADRDTAWVKVCEEVKRACERAAGEKTLTPSPSPSPSPLSRSAGGRLGEGPGVRAPASPSTGAPLLDLSRLPIPGPQFVGREAEMARLDAAWEDPKTHVLVLVAFGGVGKSALVARWLDRLAAEGWRGAERVLDWSFYSQGSEERTAAAEPFLDHALRFCGDADPRAGSPYERGARLARLLQEQRTLLVLDGLEPMQYPPGRPEVAGRLKDPSLKALLRGLAGANPGLCVVTTREEVADLHGFGFTAPQLHLEELSPAACVALLRELGVEGKGKELEAAAKGCGRHALTVSLLGNFLRRAHGGDVRKWKEVDLQKADEKQGGHAGRVIRAYVAWLGEGPELSILRLLGLFDRPADAASLKALRAEPTIAGLTESLVPLSQLDWHLAVSTLREQGLLLAADRQEPETLDAHPLVRAHFAEELERDHPAAWQEGNRRLYEHLRQSAPELPETLEEMQPLYTAIVHGCRAGRQQETMDEVFAPRVRRRNQHFAVNILGGWASDLSGLAAFFEEPWSRPSGNLSIADQAFVLGEAAFGLRALGRLAEAVEPMQAGLDLCRSMEDWKNAAISASNLSELTLTLGEVARAVAFGKQSVELADRSESDFERMVNRTTLADAIHQAGRWQESQELLCEAEGMQAERQPLYPRLYSLWGFRHCDLLLSLAEPEDGAGLDGLDGEAAIRPASPTYQQTCSDVLERADQTLDWAKRGNLSLLTIALDHLSLGRAHLGLALTERDAKERAAHSAQAEEQLDKAVDGLRRAGTEHHIPRALLARASLRRFTGDLPGAEADLREVLEIAERGPMRLHECDAHLEWTRLARQQSDLPTARQHLARARELVQQTGYGRRDREVRSLEGELGGG